MMKKRYIKFFCLLLIVLFYLENLQAQRDHQYHFDNSFAGFPLIKNYLPKDYKAHNQNWAIAKDNRGVMYFGNSTGVLEFDGHTWNLIKVPNSIVRSLAVDDLGNVFVGSADDLGYLKDNFITGKKDYQSLLKQLPIKESIGHVWYTFFVDQKIFFICKNYIFQFTFEKGKYNNPNIKYWKANTRFKIAHSVNGQLYVLDADQGLLLFNGKDFERIKGSEIFLDNTIYSMLPYNDGRNEILIATKKGKLFLYNGKAFLPFQNDVEDYLIKNNLYIPGTKLSDGSFAFNTSRAGIIIINKHGKVVRKIDMATGIPDDGVLYSFYSDNKLWLALQNGISVIDLPTPITYFNQNAGLKGSISDLKIIKNNLYAASTAGIFELQSNNQTIKPSFKEISNIAQEGWQVLEIDNKIFTILTDGIYEITGNGFSKINSSLKGFYTIYKSKYNPYRIFCGLENGTAIFDYSSKHWTEIGKVEGITSAVRNIAEDGKGNLWLGTPYSGVFKFSNLNEKNLLKPDIKQFLIKDLMPDNEVKIFETDITLLFCTKSSVLVYDEIKNDLIPESRLGLNKQLGRAEILSLLQDKNKNIWISVVKANKQLAILYGVKTGEKYEWKELSFLKSVIDFSNANAVFSIFKDEKTGIVWFSGADGIVSLDSKFIETINDKINSVVPMIRKVSINRDSLIFAGDDLFKTSIGIGQEFNLTSEANLIRFEFSSLTYENDLAEYQFKLDGFDEDWSDWTTEHRKDYTNLSPGKYKFKVRAKNIFNIVSSESTFEFIILTPWYLSWWAYLLYSAAVVGLLFLILDYRLKYLEQKNSKLESVVAERTKQIKEQAEKLKEMDELKSRFFANISHEFRTPLTLILGQIESVQNFISDLKIKNKLQMGYRNARRLERLINQLLEISKIESGKDSLKVSKINIVKYLKSIFYSFESIAEKKKIQLEFETEKEFIELYIDWEKIEKVFNNLINNAIKFTNFGGMITLSINKIDENMKDSDLNIPHVKISISDSGIGIAEDKLKYIFDRFYQVDRKKFSDTEGSGIGLALAKELVEQHLGNIYVTSKENEGSTFIVKIPFGLEHKNNIQENIQNNFESEYFIEQRQDDVGEGNELIKAEFKSEKDDDVSEEVILVIDDNPDIREFISEHLEENYSVIQAANGKIGIEKAKKTIPDLIISDIMMPLIDGYELSSKLKIDPVTSHIPIIILTAKASQDDKITGLETGADDYLIKPFNSKELLIRVKNLISNRKQLRQKFSFSEKIEKEVSSKISLDEVFLQKVSTSILNNISKPDYAVEQLADEVSFSVSQLNRKLKALTDQTAGHYIRTIRLEKAGQLLRSKAASIKEIAYQVGFTEQSNFAKSFKKHFGLSPSEFIGETEKS